MEQEFENISLSKRVDLLLKQVNAIDMEVVKPDDGIGVKVMTSDRKTKVEATEFGYKIKTKDRNIKVIPNEYVRLSTSNPALLISSARKEIHYDKDGNRIYDKESVSKTQLITGPIDNKEKPYD